MKIDCAANFKRKEGIKEGEKKTRTSKPGRDMNPPGFESLTEAQREAVPCQDLTDDQRTALQEKIQLKFEAALSELVDEGTITQEQADQLLRIGGAKLHRGPGMRVGRQGIGPGNAWDKGLDSANSANTTL